MKKLFFTPILLVLFLTTINAQTSLPELELKSIEGKSINLKQYSKDKLIVYSFWATWCIPCMNELDAIAEQYDDWQEEVNFELVAVSIDDARTKSRIKPLVNGKGWEYMVLLDSNQALKRALNIANVPYVIIVKNGKIVYSHSGYTPGSEEDLFEKLKTL